MLQNSFLKNACILTTFVLIPFSHGQRDLEVLKENTERWIEIRSRLSKEQSDWLADKEILQTSIETLESTKASVSESLEFQERHTKELREKYAQAEALQQDHLKTNELLAENIAEYEKRIQELATRLPDPLVDKIKSLLDKIPESRDDQQHPLPNRLQNVVAIMTLIDEFNNSLNHSHAIKELDSGEILDVRILYWGISVGFATNSTGTKAWRLQPSDTGWSWNNYDQNASEVKKLFDVYDKAIDPQIIPLPLSLEKKGGEA